MRISEPALEEGEGLVREEECPVMDRSLHLPQVSCCKRNAPEEAIFQGGGASINKSTLAEAAVLRMLHWQFKLFQTATATFTE